MYFFGTIRLRLLHITYRYIFIVYRPTVLFKYFSTTTGIFYSRTEETYPLNYTNKRMDTIIIIITLKTTMYLLLY